MNKFIILLGFLVSYSISIAQVTQIDLEQAPGLFTTTELNLSSGNYQFNITNSGVDHEVGFVLVPKGKYDAEHHITNAYVKAPVANGSSSATNVVHLEAGDYEYFCPLNPTPKYSVRVHDKVQTVQFHQEPGLFKAPKLSLKEGVYQFEVINNNVDHEVGFVLVPKGKYDATHHITEAYVKAPVVQGSSSMTNIIELQAGEYEYFCPLNPTPKYSLSVSK